MADVVLIKLGGSLITDKRKPESVRRGTLRRLAGEIASAARKSRARLVVGHGAGSFGHVAAARHGLNGGPCRPEQLRGVSITQDRAASLHRLVVRALQKAGVVPYSLAPSSFLTATAGRPTSVQLEPLLLAIESRMLPVVFGDVVLDHRWGACICSTETVFLALARRLRGRGHRIRRVLWLGQTDGIYDASGRTISRIEPRAIKRMLKDVGGSDGTDVTGGMSHRLQVTGTLARMGISSWILDGRVRGRLRRALAGDDVPGTRIG